LAPRSEADSYSLSIILARGRKLRQLARRRPACPGEPDHGACSAPVIGMAETNPAMTTSKLLRFLSLLFHLYKSPLSVEPIWPLSYQCPREGPTLISLGPS